ncbi:ATP synthase F0 subunit C [Candidatus Dependentiae bacterium]|nr:ATP synthase F0 subunit C [Candidatus Dependentiae bacterium]
MDLAIAYVKIAAYLGAAFVLGIGVLGPALGQGKVGATACENIGKYPESSNKIRGAMFLAMGIIETSAIYALLISAGLILVGFWA